MTTAQQQMEAIANLQAAVEALDRVHVYCHPDDEAAVRGAVGVVLGGRGVVHAVSTMKPGVMRLQREPVPQGATVLQ